VIEFFRKTHLKFINETVVNKRYLLISAFICIYLLSVTLLAETGRSYLAATIYAAGLLFLVSMFSKHLFVLLSLVTIMINAIIIHIYLRWGSGDVGARFQIAALSPKSERTEYLEYYLAWQDMFSVLYAVVGIIVVIFFIKKFSETFKSLKITSIVVFLAASFILHNNIHKAVHIVPYHAVYSYFSPVDVEKLLERSQLVAQIGSEQEPSGYLVSYDKIIIILGESANKNHMGLYGYERNTTPFLSELVQNEHTFKFDAISPTNQTRFSIPLAFTDASVADYDKFFTSPSITTELNIHGYKSYWYSNQGVAGVNENAIRTLVTESDVHETANLVGDDAKEDMILLDYFDNKINEDKEVYVLHLAGSHIKYDERYPSKKALITEPESQVDHYDNTIHYTDILLREIFKKFSGEKVLFIYLSDHGEVAGKGHGYSPPFKEEYDIPLFIHSSFANDRLLDIKKINSQAPLNMESFNLIVKYIVGFDLDLESISRSPTVVSIKMGSEFNYNELKYHKEGDSLYGS
jgi:glucan phosphoethanolaminetransferase (alkaline phosphatase superfamily)